MTQKGVFLINVPKKNSNVNKNRLKQKGVFFINFPKKYMVVPLLYEKSH